MLVSKCVLALALALPLLADNTLPAPGNLTVHEWGTFTSVAGPEGNPIAWLPLSGPGDLPCFVHHLAPPNPKFIMYSLVRMETPVMYFYASRPMALSVHVGFPMGLITEWYPQAAHVTPTTLDLGLTNSRIDWENLQVSSAGATELPRGKGSSRYYAARATDGATVQVGDEREKLIFYRGVGGFGVPLQPRFTADGRVEIRTTGEPIALAILFENRGGKMGYRAIRDLQGRVTVEAPEITNDAGDRLRVELVQKLREVGLYPKEAQAMLATWGDSWFEEGTRVMYLTPRALVDAVLPLEVTPKPQQTTRVFVGRVEVLSPAVRKMIEAALGSGDVERLAKYGRFLSGYVDQIRQQNGGRLNAAPAAAAFLQAQSTAAVKEFAAPSCVK